MSFPHWLSSELLRVCYSFITSFFLNKVTECVIARKHVCVRALVCVRERDRQTEGESTRACVYACVFFSLYLYAFACAPVSLSLRLFVFLFVSVCWSYSPCVCVCAIFICLQVHEHFPQVSTSLWWRLVKSPYWSGAWWDRQKPSRPSSRTKAPTLALSLAFPPPSPSPATWVPVTAAHSQQSVCCWPASSSDRQVFVVPRTPPPHTHTHTRSW